MKSERTSEQMSQNNALSCLGVFREAWWSTLFLDSPPNRFLHVMTTDQVGLGSWGAIPPWITQEEVKSSTFILRTEKAGM